MMAETWLVEPPGSSSPPAWPSPIMGFPDERLKDAAGLIVCMVAMIASKSVLHWNQEAEFKERPNHSLDKHPSDSFEVDYDVYSSDDDWDELWGDPYAGPELRDGSEKSATATTPPDGTEKVSSDPTSMPTGTNHKSSLYKRPMRDSEEGDDNEPRNWRINKHQKSDENPRPLHFACPYFRHNPPHYGDCFRYKLTRIADVKQHLKRNHRQPTHCNICLEELPSEDALHDHIRAQKCRKREYIAPDGMTPLQERKVISRAGNKNKLVTEQWFEIYDILFPGAPKPESVYLGDRLAEDIKALRQFMSQQGLVLIVQELQRGNFQLGNGQEPKKQLQNALFNAFDVFLSRQNSARNEAIGRRSSRPETVSQQGEGEEGQGRESGCVERETTTVPDGNLEFDAESLGDEDTPDEET